MGAAMAIGADTRVDNVDVVFVRLGMGRIGEAERRHDLPGRIYEHRENGAVRFWRMERREGDVWPRAVEVTAEMSAYIEAQRRASAAAERERLANYAKALGRAARREPVDWQERAEPTEGVMATISAERTKEHCRRRKPDARVWGEMTAEQELAADRIVRGHLLTGGTIGVPTARYGVRLDRSQPSDPASLREFEGRVARCYKEWVRECRRQGVPFADVLDYLTKGVTMAQIDAANGKRKGTARERFFEALDLHTKISPAFFRRPLPPTRENVA